MIAARLRFLRGPFRLQLDFESDARVLGIFGPSGAGKSTLIELIAGLVDPNEGRIRLDARLLCDLPGGGRLRPEQRRIGLVAQEPLLFPGRSVRANLEYSPGAPGRVANSRGGRILEILGLGPLLDRPVEQLSGGQAQRVAIGRAIFAAPELLLLDEATSALDGALAREVLALLVDVRRELSCPMIFVTHRVGELLALADECLVLDAGQLVAQGPPLEVLAKPRAAELAQLSAIDNLLRLEVLQHDDTEGVTLLALGRQRLRVPRVAAAAGERIAVAFTADDLILCREMPPATSARNRLAARVRSVTALGNQCLVRMKVEGVEGLLSCRVTQGARNELGLSEGVELVALLKTSACHPLGERGGGVGARRWFAGSSSPPR